MLADFAARHGVPVAETQAGKGALVWDHPCAMGAIGVTGGTAANALAAEADRALLAVGTRLSDFTHRVPQPVPQSVGEAHSAERRRLRRGEARRAAVRRRCRAAGLDAPSTRLSLHGAAPADWTAKARSLAAEWNEAVTQATASSNAALPSDAQVLGAVNRASWPDAIDRRARPAGCRANCTNCGAAEQARHLSRRIRLFLHGVRDRRRLGTQLAMPDREVWVLVGDGSYLMMNSEIATSVMLDKKLNIVVLDNGGFGCIDRLQRSCGGASFNNLFANGSGIDFARPCWRASARYRAKGGEPCRTRKSAAGGTCPSVALQ